MRYSRYRARHRDIRRLDDAVAELSSELGLELGARYASWSGTFVEVVLVGPSGAGTRVVIPPGEQDDVYRAVYAARCVLHLQRYLESVKRWQLGETEPLPHSTAEEFNAEPKKRAKMTLRQLAQLQWPPLELLQQLPASREDMERWAWLWEWPDY